MVRVAGLFHKEKDEMFKFRKDKVTWNWRTQRSEKLYNLYCSCNIVVLVKWWITYVRQEVCMGGRKVYAKI